MSGDGVTSEFDPVTFISAPGKVSLKRAIGLYVCPVVQRDDGQPVTEADKGLALLQAIRHEMSMSLSTVLKCLAAGATVEAIRVEINGELLCSVRLEP